MRLLCFPPLLLVSLLTVALRKLPVFINANARLTVAGALVEGAPFVLDLSIFLLVSL